MAQERYRVPDGLRPLLEALARETLRAQPHDLPDFALLFFTELHHHRRNNPNVDIIRDPVTYEMFRTELQRKYKETAGDIPRPASPLDQAATKIQAAFRGHRVRAHLKEGDQIQRTGSTEKMHHYDNKKDLKRHSVGGYTLDSDTPEDRAATKIQAEIRGFLTRKHVGNMKKENAEAATKIQAHIRGFLTRKHLDEQGLLSPSRSRSSLHSSRSDDLEKVGSDGTNAAPTATATATD